MLTLYLLNKYASFKPINENGRTILVMPKIYMFFGYFGTLLFIAIIIGWLVTEGYDSSMIPYFKNQDYYGGLKAGLDDCIMKWK